MLKSACFDVLGTCFDLEPAIDAISERLGKKLSAINVDPKTLFFMWFCSAQRDFIHVYIFRRLLQAYCSGLEAHLQPGMPDRRPPFRSSLGPGCGCSDAADDEAPTPTGLETCYDGLRDASCDVYGVTNNGKQTSLTYYELAASSELRRQ